MWTYFILSMPLTKKLMPNHSPPSLPFRPFFSLTLSSCFVALSPPLDHLLSSSSSHILSSSSFTRSIVDSSSLCSLSLSDPVISLSLRSMLSLSLRSLSSLSLRSPPFLSQISATCLSDLCHLSLRSPQFQPLRSPPSQVFSFFLHLLLGP